MLSIKALVLLTKLIIVGIIDPCVKRRRVVGALRQALDAVAKLTQTDIKDAADFTRKHPLWREEIHIEEELINLEEAFATGVAAGESLREYPKMRNPLIIEQRAILKHCVGLIARMMKGKQLPREYNEQDAVFAVTKLIRLVVNEAMRVGKKIDEEILKVFKPYLSFRQRWQLQEWSEFDWRLELRLLKQRLVLLRRYAASA